MNRLRFFFAALAVVLALGGGGARAAEPIYPGVEWAKGDPAKHGLDPAGLAKLADYVFAPGAHYRSDALLVAAGGELVFERYARDYTSATRHLAWSMTKSVSMALFGIAESEGKIRRGDLVSKWNPEASAPAWDGVRMEHLLSMSSGILWREGYETSPFDSHVVSALYRTQDSEDFGLFHARQTKRVSPPGERFNYSSGDTNLMMRSLKSALGDAYPDYPWSRIFTPIGMRSAVLERDASGTFVGSSYLEATPRDFLRFGYLFLREGKWQGKQIVPKEWVKLASSPSPAMDHLRADFEPSDVPYGYGWWLNRAFPAAKIHKPFPDFPDDAYFASGHEGQEMVVIPSWDVVVLRLGNDHLEDERIDLGRIGSLLRAARRLTAGSR
jgi:CubicO group peptidase (beta-lactamase class C family)